MFQKNLFKTQLENLMNHSTTTEFSEKTGFNRTYLSKYLNLKLDRPPSPHLLKTIAGPAASYEELMISCGYLNASACSKEKSIKIPILTPSDVTAISPSIDFIEEYEYVDIRHVSPNNTYFYLKVKGDNMINARISDGDLAFVCRQNDVNSGDIAIVILENRDAIITRVIKKDSIIVLQSENPSYPPCILSESECNGLKIIGKVLHIKFFVSQ